MELHDLRPVRLSIPTLTGGDLAALNSAMQGTCLQAAHGFAGKIEMGLFRLLFWIILIAAAFWLWRRFTDKPGAASKPKPEQTTLSMVRCAQCGVHVPQEQALPDRGLWYCSQAHLEQGSKSGGH